MQGMLLIVPPTCDLTVPLLGAYQMAGYAKNCGYNLSVRDYNIELSRIIINYAIEHSSKVCRITDPIEDQLEDLAIASFIVKYKDINDYESLQSKFRNCTSSREYWGFIDYMRACYDMYSLQFDDIRFRIDGFDSKYNCNIWKDIYAFIDKYSNGIIMDTLVSMIQKTDLSVYDTIGVSITFESQLLFSLLICKAIRELFPDKHIVVGGGFINSFVDSEEAMGPIADYCDCVFAGEGEALIEYLNNGHELHAHNTDNGSGIRACFLTPSDVVNSPLHVQPPYFTQADLQGFISPKSIIPLRFSYDCYWGKCRFCSDKETHECLDKEYDIARMIDFCKSAISYGSIGGIYFLDSAIKPRDVRKFATSILEAGYSIQWGTNLRFEKAFDDDELIELMAKSGCVFAKFGLESGSQRVLDLMHKGTDVKVAASIISKFRKHGIFVHTYVMVAFPGEEPADRQKTREFLLSEHSHPDNYNISEFILYGSADISKEYRHMLKVSEFEGEGWHSSQYESFTNDSIRAYISDLRREFDNKFNPQSVLMTTGHTIAYANTFIQSKSTDIKSKYVSLSKRVLYTSVSDIPCMLWWRRNKGCQYIIGEWATYLWHMLYRGISVAQYKNLGIPESFTDLLWENSCICYSEECVEMKELPRTPGSLPEIRNKNSFSSMSWYGQYDAN